MRELLIEMVANIEEDKALFIAKQMLASGATKDEIISAVHEGLEQVGKMFEKTEYYIADLMMAGILFNEILGLKGMENKNNPVDTNFGILMIATVEDDLHDIGKNLFGALAAAEGFKVIDLGIDVDKNTIIDNLIRYKPDILGLSAILTDTAVKIKDIIAEIENHSLREDLKIIIGGCVYKKEISTEINADYIASDAFDGIKKIKEWMRELNK